MLKNYLITAALASGLVLTACGQEQETEESTGAASGEVELSTQIQKQSYVIGLNIARNMQNDGIEVDVDTLAAAMQDVVNGTESRMSDEEMQLAMEVLEQQRQEQMAALQAEMQAEQAKVGEENQAAGEAFLAENTEKEGVVTLDSGLQYKEIKPGDGAKPSAEDTVTVHYRGRLLDGTEFDSSYARNQPATFPLQQVIAGWTEGLQQMPVGSTYELYIPSELAYGPGGSPPRIGPNATLVFEVELLEIEEAEQ